MLVLAAGGSRRLGRPKQLVRVGGESLVGRAVRIAESLGPAWLGVVVGAQAARTGAVARAHGAVVVRAARWREGLSASLRAGVRRVPPSATRLLIMTVDQWRIEREDLWRLLRAAGRGSAAAAYSGRLGVPAVFPRRRFAELLSLRGDVGARALLADRSTPVPMPRAAQDLDTPVELAALRAQPPRAPGRRTGATRRSGGSRR